MFTNVAQPQSAQRSVAAAGIRHGDKALVEVTVGVTPRGVTQTQVAHCCSSRVRLKELICTGDGAPIPVTDAYPVRIRGDLCTVRRPVIARFDAIAHSNGVLNITPVRRAKCVPVPAEMLDEYPWAFEGGAEAVAAAYGCRTVDEMFEKHGQLA